ncbi:TetR/AcrR family transcriptional regulator [Myxococcus llanfairpwllgwyngyllgogerychwyrndrobwllllantysiliogogogochensis]|uniref:TetR/AcrR family transcriptional regulator n=1 Tax=Myxococcus llanfairpwllgwyngyllgogerychwyrndrobwllllantysiliogogogochensis TaxID=2590453 RepID=A0A540X6H8_9BACT|nr:TetR/AcrR family transcriptional regulator [Myxococcus llanfairpwllgwyngyllgogerychwyrndrobwllllantysiliogogogochensis]TQF16885.1 TetR/AcrR family transcriptional regulator [Myxococcus llanfairpwllgwyngyllgogerychwyrndrobwllllantysiliogogogochensis]
MPRADRTKPRGGQGDKRQALLTGALTVFARDGYTRASIDMIADEAGVSTRTLYNHFQDKARLFQAVIEESASRVAEAQTALLDRHLRKVTNLETDLIELALAWGTPMPDSAEHFALVRQVNAEAGHIPAPAIKAWREAGPLRVRRELARHLRRLADEGLLRVEDPERAALHFTRLVSVPGPHDGGLTLTRKERAEHVASGVRVFLYGYGR